MKSPIIYYGGKTSMLQEILPIIPSHDVYTEVFFGGGAVFFSKKKAKNETINDRLDIVITFYQQVKRNFKALKSLIDATCYSRSLFEKALFIIRNKEMFEPVQLAWSFWLVSNFSHSNKIGGGFKYSNDKSMCPAQVMKNMKKEFTDRLIDRIEDANIECREAIDVLKKRDCIKAFHYLDPPYPNADQGHYKGYSFDEFQKLLDQCELLRGNFMLSNYNSEMLDGYVQRNGWWKKEFHIKNEGVRKNGKKKVEVLVCNYVPVGHVEFDFNATGSTKN